MICVFFEIKGNMNYLIIYGTTEGHTRKIARFMEEVLKNAGHSVTIADATDRPPSLQGYDAIIIGASVHAHKYQTAVTHFVTRNADALNSLPGAFFSVSLAASSDDEEEHQEVKKITADFLAQTGWKPRMTTHIGGALKYTQYDFFKRLIMKMIAKREGLPVDTTQDSEYTDWEAVKQFVESFNSMVSEDQ
jgi:menaquinone-dependent protoporphyrinogen oxidase